MFMFRDKIVLKIMKGYKEMHLFLVLYGWFIFNIQFSFLFFLFFLKKQKIKSLASCRLDVMASVGSFYSDTRLFIFIAVNDLFSLLAHSVFNPKIGCLFFF